MIRLAKTGDIPNLETLIADSVRGLGLRHYRPEQIEAALGTAWAVDSLLISDGTYFIVELNAVIVACGGWSRRGTLFGGDALAGRVPDRLNPARDSARIRAFFVAPNHARRGLGRMLLLHCEGELRREGFRKSELVATLPGVPFYRTFGYEESERIQHPLPSGSSIEFVRMRKDFPPR